MTKTRGREISSKERWRVDTKKVVGVKFLFRQRDVTQAERDVDKASRTSLYF